jgi:hypothetical protein
MAVFPREEHYAGSGIPSAEVSETMDREPPVK